MNHTTTISKYTVKRLAKDIKEIYKNPLTEHNIYYIHNDDDILKGSALIIGPTDTIYEGGYYIFSFKFPCNYPHSPPVVTFNTNDGITRYHPNLYKSGKVCLSIINTWSGEPWSGCQTISSILLTISSLLTNDSLLHEPGITVAHPDFNSYHEIIRYKNIEFSICNFITKPYITNEFKELLIIIKENFINTYEEKKKLIQKTKLIFEKSNCSNNITTTIYRLNCYINYDNLNSILEETYNKLKLC
jgi:ubiquitin-conjugating enzyme E2 Z